MFAQYHVIGNNQINCASPGGRYLTYLSDEDAPFFRVSLSPFFSNCLLEPVVKTCQRENFVRPDCYLV